MAKYVRFIQGIAFNRRELSGAFGDIGTDFPLIVGMIQAAGLHTPSVLITFGLLQLLTGVIYRLPMPVQPLKAMATLVIAQHVGESVLLGAGVSIGLVMLILTVTGLLTKIATLVPHPVVRGIQLGLGINLTLLALQKYIPANGLPGFALALGAFAIVVGLIDQKRYPVSIFVISLGILYTGLSSNNVLTHLSEAFGLHLPRTHMPSLQDIIEGFLLLALPQIPLSLSNSIIATHQVVRDLFPAKSSSITVTKIGLTYSLMNLFTPLLGGIPCCHGSSGMVGHYAFGGRTGGSVIIYGLFYLAIGLFLGNAFDDIVKLFPLPILGTILVVEGLSFILLVRDLLGSRRDFTLAVFVGLIAAGLPYGFVVGMSLGTILYYLPVKLDTFASVDIRPLDATGNDHEARRQVRPGA